MENGIILAMLVPLGIMIAVWVMQARLGRMDRDMERIQRQEEMEEMEERLARRLEERLLKRLGARGADDHSRTAP